VGLAADRTRHGAFHLVGTLHQALKVGADLNDPGIIGRTMPGIAGPAPKRRVLLRVALVALFVAAATAGTLSGVLFVYADDLPEITALDHYQPGTITRLVARDGRVVSEFATEPRIVIDYDEMAPVLRQAIVATEDGNFERHFGINITRTVAAVLRNVVFGEHTGASTITQQVARLLFLQQEYMEGGVFARSGTRGYERKIREWLLALQLEKRFTKREIFAFYANQSNLGLGIYGVEAASRAYFHKPAGDLTLDEAASIAAIFQTPARLSPFVNPDQNLRRRNAVVLRRMVNEGFLTRAEADAAAARPLVVQPAPAAGDGLAAYFAEEIRQGLERAYGADVLYQAGLRVQTTLDADLQRAANRALDRGLRAIDKRRTGYRRAARNLIAEGTDPARFSSDRWRRIDAGDIVPAVVTAAPQDGDARVRIGSAEVTLPRAGYAWTRRTSPAALFRVGDVIEVAVSSLNDGSPGTVVLEQVPLLEGAIVAIENHTGQVLAMVGGHSFARSKFNRAVQARRQLGSVFKPIIYTAAIDRGYTPVSVFIDEPIAMDVGPNQPPYSPQNYDRTFEGPVTLRRAIEQSRNIPAVKAMAELGPQQVVDFAARFGFRQPFQPFLSTALGAGEATLIEVTSAYSAFPNQGLRMRPYSVVSVADREGNVLEEHRPESHDAIRADTAFVMTHLLRGVVQRGTAASAASLGWPLAGKTGTVDDNTDAWFVGFDPDITVGVWVGYDEKKTIGANETGSTAALPIWIDFMRAYIEARGDRSNPPGFEAPGNIVYVTLASGLTEAFISGTQPQDDFPGPGDRE
jgi:penicillin-binding protein 1A